jgi:hypothetical protein
LRAASPSLSSSSPCERRRCIRASRVRSTDSMAATRARRARMTSTCAAAMISALSNRSLPAEGPAMASAKAAIFSASAGSSAAGRLKPCRSALPEERALPSGVFGPRLRRPFFLLASRRASVTTLLPAFYVPVLFYTSRNREASRICRDFACMRSPAAAHRFSIWRAKFCHDIVWQNVNDHSSYMAGRKYGQENPDEHANEAN